VVLEGVGLFLARVAEGWVHWERADAVYARLRRILDQVPEGGRLPGGYPAEAVDASGIPSAHLPTLAIAGRRAFVLPVFACRRQPISSISPRFGRRGWSCCCGAGRSRLGVARSRSRRSPAGAGSHSC